MNTVELIDALLDDAQTRCIVAYIEGMKDGRALLEVGRRAAAVGKPLLLWKAGVTEQGARAAASHTASMTGSYDFYRAVFKQTGRVVHAVGWVPVTRIRGSTGPLAEWAGVRSQRPGCRLGAPPRQVARHVPCRGRDARSAPARGSCPCRPAGGPPASDGRPIPLPLGVVPVLRRSRGSRFAGSVVVDVRRAARRPAHAGRGPAARRAARRGGRPVRRPSGRPMPDAGTGRRRPTRRRRSGSRRSRPGCRRPGEPIRTEPRTTIGWMPDGVLHDPRLQHVHDHDPADASSGSAPAAPPTAGGPARR